MAQIVRFTDRPGGTVLLDVSPSTAGTNVQVGQGGVQAPPPPVNRVVSSNPMQEGGVVTLQPAGMREVTLPLAYTGGLPDTTAAQQARRNAVQALMRVLTMDDVWLELRPDNLSESRYLHCYRSSDPDLVARLDGLGDRWAELTVKLPADPYALGPKESLGLISTSTSTDMRALIAGSSVKGEAPAPLVCQWTHPGGQPILEQFSVWVSSHTPGAFAAVVYPLSAAGGTLPGSSTRTTVANSNAIGGSVIRWGNVPRNQEYQVSSFTITGPSGGAIVDRGTYRAFALLKPGATDQVSNVERWRISLRIANSLFAGQGDTEIAVGDASVRAGSKLDLVVDLGLVDIPFAGRSTAIGYDAPTAITSAAVKVFANCLDGGGASQAATDLDFDAIVLLPADDTLALVQYLSSTSARNFTLDPINGVMQVRDNLGLNIAHQPFISYSGGGPVVVPGQDVSIAMLGATGGFADPLRADTLSALASSFTATYWPRYLAVV